MNSYLPEKANDELRDAKSIASSLQWQMRLFIASAVTAGLLLCITVPSEYSMVKAVFDYLAPIENLEDYVQISNEFKAVVLLIAIVAIHFAFPFRRNLTVNRIIVFMSIFLFISVGFGLAYVNVEPWLSENDIPEALNNLDTNEGTVQHWLVEAFKENVLPIYPMLFALGLPFMTAVVAYCTHQLIGILVFSIREIISIRSVIQELGISSKSVMDAAVKRQEINDEIELTSRQIKQRDLSEIIYVSAKQALAKGKQIVSDREAFPDLGQIILDAEKSNSKKNVFVTMPLKEAKELINKLEDQITLEKIKQALEGRYQ